MKSSHDLLSSALKTAQMGQIGLECVLDYPVKSELRQAIMNQIKEYRLIEQQIKKISETTSIPVSDLNPRIKTAAKMMAAVRLSHGDVDSRIACMVINGNTRGMIKGLKNKNHSKFYDKKVSEITDHLLGTEVNNIFEMQRFV